jgi:hypothetical protein
MSRVEGGDGDAVRLALVERLRPLERAASRAAFERKAAELLRGRSHELGNHVQIVRLASLELEKRCAGPDIAELVGDLRTSAEQATTILHDLIAAARPVERTEPGPPVAHHVRAGAEAARAVVPGGLDIAIDLPADVRSLCSGDELEGLVIGALLDMPRATVQLRARTIGGKPWVQLLCIGARHDRVEYESFVEALASQAGGEVSVSPGRDGTELAIELPVAPGS